MRTGMARFAAVGAGALLLLATVATPAAAARPGHGTGGFSYDLTFAAGEVCPFAIHWVEDGSRMQALAFPVWPNGDQLSRFTGPQWSTFTNLDDPGVPPMVVGGGLRLDLIAHPDGTADIWVDGTVVYVSFATDVMGPSAWLLHGKAHDTLAASGSSVTHSFNGNAVDLCAALAG